MSFSSYSFLELSKLLDIINKKQRRGVGVFLFKGDSDSGPYPSHLNLCVILLQSEFCVIYFTTKTLFLRVCALLLDELKIY